MKTDLPGYNHKTCLHSTTRGGSRFPLIQALTSRTSFVEI